MYCLAGSVRVRVVCIVQQFTNPFSSNRLTNFNKRYLQRKYKPPYICVINLTKTKNQKPNRYEQTTSNRTSQRKCRLTIQQKRCYRNYQFT